MMPRFLAQMRSRWRSPIAARYSVGPALQIVV